MGYIGYPFKQKGKASADFLYNLGLFKGREINSGTSPDYALESPASREESLVMLIRLLGKEHEAVNYPKTHPFTDVSEWADGYVSYAYENGSPFGEGTVIYGLPRDESGKILFTEINDLKTEADGKILTYSSEGKEYRLNIETFTIVP